MNPDPEEFKERQRTAWNQVAAGWSRQACSLSRATRELDRALFDAAGLARGTRVLEVGCGTGEQALAMARTVGATGEVLAVDLAPEMLHAARERVRGLGLEHLEFREADAETLALGEPAFDAVVARWCIMLLAEPERAVERIRAHLKPGGRFACAVWGTPDQVPFIALPRAIAIEFGQEVPPPDAPGPLRLGQPGLLEDLLEGVFTDVAVQDRDVDFAFGSPEQYLGFLVDCSSSTGHLLAGEEGEEIAERLVAAVEAHRGADGRIVLPSRVRIASARA